MRKLLFIICLFTSLFVNAQDKPIAEMNFTEATVNSLKFSVDSAEELKDINWDDIKEIFSENKPEDLILLEFEVNYPKDKKDAKKSYKFTSKGKSKNIDNTIAMAKKILNKLTKI
ncbi:hypothetical protein LPB136_13050 [Tenacibaculum todarodis]|uniref:Uncharacterized protein n=1 Tax=Tenacibaculum todarodis TaxID=1850252 RepID=A0A1L3JMD1_9FLAO|nr:hypothetical protein [Tenacibaculum todarodis]APG66244.1 hypothetical protein LPB136_13050 [Tenacibaculum todarodis]